MKRIIYPVLALSLAILACGVPATMTPQPPVVTAPPVVTNVTCGRLSFYLDPALGSGFNCKTIPEANEPDMPYFAINPEYIEVTLQGYPLTDKFFEPRIDLYPVQRYGELAPDFIPERVQTLQNLIAGGAPGDSNLPFLPIFNAAQVFSARYGVVGFQNGSGIRYLTLFAQYAAPINNHDLLYTYQGLTSDGQYWVSVILPISNPILPADSTNPPGGQSWEDFSSNYPAYAADMTIQLNAQPPDSFAPTLTLLDALINSIIIIQP